MRISEKSQKVGNSKKIFEDIAKNVRCSLHNDANVDVIMSGKWHEISHNMDQWRIFFNSEEVLLLLNT